MRTLITGGCVVAAVCLIGLGASSRSQNPRNLSQYLTQQQAFALLNPDYSSAAMLASPNPSDAVPGVLLASDQHDPVADRIEREAEEPPSSQPKPLIAQVSEAAPATPPVRTWAPRRQDAERRPSDHAPVDASQPTRVRVVTIRARVTAYTAYDHAETEPHWADGIVAWHPGGRQRRVANSPYGLATDWSQFPPGATFIRVPGYMERSFPSFPESFRVVDDACGQSRIARRRGLQPVIDVRFMTRYSAIDPRGGWGSRQLDVEVIYPEDFQIPASLRRWVVKEEWHTYHNGDLVERQRLR